MGYMRHHAMVVTAWDSAAIDTAHAEAERLLAASNIDEFGTVSALVSPVIASGMNGYQSFFVAPDGSKEWWERSNRGEDFRADFIDWMRDSGLYLTWALVQYGDEEHVNRVLLTDDDDAPPPRPVRSPAG